MSLDYFSDQHVEKIEYSLQPLPKGEYENCKFSNCNFANSTVSECIFSTCEFKNCNLSLVNLNKTALRYVAFIDCKLTGLQFQTCNDFLFAVRFENCIINLASFYNLKIKKTTFKNSRLHEVDFAEADLSSSIFDGCDLSRAIFDNTDLSASDFRTAFNYSIDPERNKIKKAKFSLSGVMGLLEKYEILIE